jgi:hypothetical protein
MKKYISAFLIPCFLLNIFGCYSLNEIPREDYSKYIADEELELNIKLKDGKSIISKEYEHIVVSEPSEFICGKANINDGHEAIQNVNIKLFKDEIDSVDRRYYQYNKGLICWSNGKMYSFSGQNYFYITADSANGFYVRGIKEGGSSTYYGRLSTDDIFSVKAKESDGTKTAILTFGIVLIGVAIYLVGSYIVSQDIKENWDTY